MKTLMSAEEVIQGGLSRWEDCEGLKEMTLLRLSLLRELIHNLHSEKSRCLAGGKKAEVQEIKEWEQRLEKIRNLPVLSGSLMNLLQDPKSDPRKKRLIPEALFSTLDREKLLRYDRKWEACIAAEAASLGWNFWLLDTWVKISQIEEWNTTLSETLWPHALVLFAESASFQLNEPISIHEELWQGRWFIVLHPDFKHPTELSLNLNRWPGAPAQPPHPPVWKLLYPD